jgi:glycosyltransferase involved in cell wall biosynthesis
MPVSANAPTFAIFSKARGTYYKPLYEAFAQAQPAPWRTLLVWPANNGNEHPDELVTPRARNLDLLTIAADRSRPRQAWRMLNAHSVRGILVHEYSAFTLQALIYAKVHGLPVAVLTDVGRRNAHQFNLRVRLWHNFWSRFVNGIAAGCPAAHDSLSGRSLPTTAVYHAVDSRIYMPHRSERKPEDPVVFAYVGKLIQPKGLDLMLHAAACLKKRCETPFKLRLIGRGDEEWLRRLIHQHGLQDDVEIPGFLSGESLRNALQTADVFVLPSRQDTYAAVVHEAACLGLPLLVSRHAGAAEALVRAGHNGFVFTPEDITGFMDFMGRMLNADLRARMAPISREMGESHSAHVRGRCLWEWFERNWLPFPTARDQRSLINTF